MAGPSMVPLAGRDPVPPALPAQDLAVEVELDIEIAGAAAPAASIAVYFVGTAGSNAWGGARSHAFGDTTKNPLVISISYALAEDQDSAPPQFKIAVDQALTTAAAAGRTVLVSSGVTVTAPGGASALVSSGVMVTAPGGASAVEPADQFTYN
jgi:subtilase family serine protease